MIDELIIRESTPGDDQAVGRLLGGMPGQSPGTAGGGESGAAGIVLVACHGDELVGALSLLPPGSRGNPAWIDGAAGVLHLAVEAAWRGCGLAGDLVDSAEGMARRWGVAALCVRRSPVVEEVAELLAGRGYRELAEGFLMKLAR